MFARESPLPMDCVIVIEWLSDEHITVSTLLYAGRSKLDRVGAGILATPNRSCGIQSQWCRRQVESSRCSQAFRSPSGRLLFRKHH